MKRLKSQFLLAGLIGGLACSSPAQDLGDSSGSSSSPTIPSRLEDTGEMIVTSPHYVLRRGDVVLVKVYQEDDLTSLTRIGKDGTITMPLLGAVKVVSNSLEQASTVIRDLLAKDYLVHPQVTINVAEFAKRRFTVLGQVLRPGTFDMPPDDSVTLLQAIATAGGYTRIANPRKITVQRSIGTEKKQIKLDTEALATAKDEKPFEILPDDVIIVSEKWF